MTGGFLLIDPEVGTRAQDFRGYGLLNKLGAGGEGAGLIFLA